MFCHPRLLKTYILKSFLLTSGCKKLMRSRLICKEVEHYRNVTKKYKPTIVLPSAPPENIYPQIIPPDFRMQKVNEIASNLNKEVEHYRNVTKKYKRAKKVVNLSAAGSSVLSAVFSSASFGSALSIVGLPATIPLGGLGGGFAIASSGLIIGSKKLDSKIKKHQEIVTLAIAKRDTVDRLLSKAMTDNSRFSSVT